MSHSVPVVSFQSDLSFTKMAFLICKRSLAMGTKRLTYQSRWQTRPLQSKESIVATSSADSSKSKIWAFSIIRDFVTDLGIVILPRCTWNHIDTYILKPQNDFITFHYIIIIFRLVMAKPWQAWNSQWFHTLLTAQIWHLRTSGCSQTWRRR